MYASVTTGQIQPGKLDEFLAILKETTMPVIKDFAGLKSFSVLTDADTNKFLITAIYKTETDAERTQASGDGPKAFSPVASFIIPESVNREAYKANVQVNFDR